MLKLIVKKIYYFCKDKLQKADRNSIFYSVKSVCKYFKIDYFEVEYNINKKVYIDKIKAKEPDVIISSNSLFFGPELLKIPKYGCLNRHSSLLPSYGGLWPVFQSFRSGEKQFGVSVHIMENKIDEGIILAQEAFQVQDDDTIDKLYQKCFKISSNLVMQALEKIKKGNFKSIINDFSPSYFRFPAKEHWVEFRRRDGRFI